MGRNKFTFGILSIRRYLKIARERFAIIWNGYAINERLLIVKHGTNSHCSAEMITTSKLTAPKNKMAPVTCVVGRSVIPIYAMAFQTAYLPTLRRLDGVSVFFISPKSPSAETEISVF